MYTILLSLVYYILIEKILFDDEILNQRLVQKSIVGDKINL